MLLNIHYYVHPLSSGRVLAAMETKVHCNTFKPDGLEQLHLVVLRFDQAYA